MSEKNFPTTKERKSKRKRPFSLSHTLYSHHKSISTTEVAAAARRPHSSVFCSPGSGNLFGCVETLQRHCFLQIGSAAAGGSRNQKEEEKKEEEDEQLKEELEEGKEENNGEKNLILSYKCKQPLNLNKRMLWQEEKNKSLYSSLSLSLSPTLCLSFSHSHNMALPVKVQPGILGRGREIKEVPPCQWRLCQSKLLRGGSPPIGRCPSVCNSRGPGSGKCCHMPQSGVGEVWGEIGGSWRKGVGRDAAHLHVRLLREEGIPPRKLWSFDVGIPSRLRGWNGR